MVLTIQKIAEKFSAEFSFNKLGAKNRGFLGENPYFLGENPYFLGENPYFLGENPIK